MGRFAEAMKMADEDTNKDFNSRISSLTTMKDSQIQKLCPTKADKEKLLELLEIVNNATRDNKEIVKFKKNIDKFADITLHLLKGFI